MFVLSLRNLHGFGASALAAVLTFFESGAGTRLALVLPVGAVTLRSAAGETRSAFGLGDVELSLGQYSWSRACRRAWAARCGSARERRSIRLRLARPSDSR